MRVNSDSKESQILQPWDFSVSKVQNLSNPTQNHHINSMEALNHWNSIFFYHEQCMNSANRNGKVKSINSPYLLFQDPCFFLAFFHFLSLELTSLSKGALGCEEWMERGVFIAKVMCHLKAKITLETIWSNG